MNLAQIKGFLSSNDAALDPHQGDRLLYEGPQPASLTTIQDDEGNNPRIIVGTSNQDVQLALLNTEGEQQAYEVRIRHLTPAQLPGDQWWLSLDGGVTKFKCARILPAENYKGGTRLFLRRD